MTLFLWVMVIASYVLPLILMLCIGTFFMYKDFSDGIKVKAVEVFVVFGTAFCPILNSHFAVQTLREIKKGYYE